MISIKLCRLPDDYDKKAEIKAQSLPENRAKLLKKKRDRGEYALSVFSSAEIYDFAERYTGKKRTEIVIEYEKSGKPYFGDIPCLFFSISHSFPFYAVAFSDTPVGIDIEKIRKINPKIAERMFSEKEKEYCVNDDLRFLETWTKKEAYSKCSGKGIAEGFRTFDVFDPAISEKMMFGKTDEAVFSMYTEKNIKKEKIEIIFAF
jgi:4'-phosphopantetheinyl transferase